MKTDCITHIPGVKMYPLDRFLSSYRLEITVIVAALLIFNTTAEAQTGQQLFDVYSKNPDNHSHLPNCSYAGYHYGEIAPPELPVVATLTNFGGVGDGTTDNTMAFRAAIDAVYRLGGGALFIPEGTYRVSKLIRVSRPGVVLRGAGKGRTIIKFDSPLEKVCGSTGYGTSKWNWAGGLVWFIPDDQFYNYNDNFWSAYLNLQSPYKNAIGQEWEYWKHSMTLSTIVGEYSRGQTVLTVDNASQLKPQMKIIMVYKNRSDLSLLKEIGEHALMQNYDRYGEWIGDTTVVPVWPWAVEIKSISGNTITLAQPLRVAVKKQFEVHLQQTGPIIEESGIENLTLLLDAPLNMDNNSGAGWNGVSFTRAWNCWARNVEVKNGQSGFLISSSKNLSLLNTSVVGDRMVHHPYTNRCFSMDNLYDNFTIDLTGQILGGMHGINTEMLSAGNVWTRGVMKQGTFDSHRAMSFDYIRTDIDVNNNKESNPGGAKEAGPYTGRRTVHWNVRIKENSYPDNEKGLYVYQPDCHVMAAFVGISGAAQCTIPCWGSRNVTMPWGEKGVIIADEGKVPTLANLYDQQFKLRASQQQWIHIVSHRNGMLIEGGKETSIDVAFNNSGSTASVELFVNNKSLGSKSGTDKVSFKWTPEKASAFVLQAKLASSKGSVESSPIILSSGGVEKIDDFSSAVTWGGKWSIVQGSIFDTLLHNKKAHYTGTSNSEVSVAFEGTRIDLVCFMNPTHVDATVDVYIDDILVSKSHKMSFRVQNANIVDYIPWSSGPIAPGKHTAKFVFTKAEEDLAIDYFLIHSGSSSIPTQVVHNAIPSSVKPSINLYSGFVKISNVNAEATFELVDLAGKIQIRKQINHQNSSQPISLLQLPTGMYLSKVSTSLHSNTKMLQLITPSLR